MVTSSSECLPRASCFRENRAGAEDTSISRDPCVPPSSGTPLGGAGRRMASRARLRGSRGTRSFLPLLCLLCVALFLSGCGNVALHGEALIAAERSAMDAYQAATRNDAYATQPTTAPAWHKAYLEENFKQWRYFVRSALKDLTWGPALPSEATTQPAK